jgi:predicted MPP superfamily phosphohydrolase
MTTFIFIAVAVLLLAVYIVFETKSTKLNEITIAAEKPIGDKPIKILQITDYHNFKNNKRVLALAERLDISFIVITGDLIDRKTKNFDNVYSLIDGLVKINPNIYYVLGNHEWKNKGADELVFNLEQKGVTLINNENKLIPINNKKINVFGVNYEYSKYKNINDLINKIDNKLYTILLCHRPGIAEEYEDIPVDLIISGHTHGGQIRLPFIGAVISSGGQLLPKYNKGLYKVFRDTLLYIDSGAGTTRMPIRFMDRSQISLIKIEQGITGNNQKAQGES